MLGPTLRLAPLQPHELPSPRKASGRAFNSFEKRRTVAWYAALSDLYKKNAEEWAGYEAPVCVKRPMEAASLAAPAAKQSKIRHHMLAGSISLTGMKKLCDELHAQKEEERTLAENKREALARRKAEAATAKEKEHALWLKCVAGEHTEQCEADCQRAKKVYCGFCEELKRAECRVAACVAKAREQVVATEGEAADALADLGASA